MASSLIKVVMPGKGEVTLRPTDHLATGGEGAVYLKNNYIFKLFLDPFRAQANGMAEKIKLLSQIRHPFIISPLDVLYDGQHQVVGYYMAPADGVALVKTFTNGWRDLNSFDDKQSIKLVENMREAVQAAHALGAVIVDGNETNYLAHGVEPRIIDVDSWQIGGHRATAIMPSIQDYHCAVHDEKSDWFSWGIVSFQVFTGIHPYKGTHPSFKKGDLEARMRANASVFDKQVRMNTAVRDFACVPKPLLDWYEGVFAHGDRSTPPNATLSQVPLAMTKKMRLRQTTNGSIKHERVQGFSGAIRHVSANGIAIYSDSAILKAYDLCRKQSLPSLTEVEIASLFSNQAGLLRHSESFVLVMIQGSSLQGRVVPGARDPVPLHGLTNLLPLAVTKLVTIGNRLFALNAQNDNGLVELEVMSIGAKMTLAVKHAWPVNVQSTRFFDGLGVMDCVGVPFLVVPENETLVIQRASMLTKYKLINGFGRSSHYIWLHGISRENGQIYRIELRSNGREFEQVAAVVVEDPDLNVTISMKGIAVSIEEDSMLSVLNTGGTTSKTIHDPSVMKDMTLFSLPDGIFYYVNQDIFKLSLS
ncbi:MAG: hypothetical protein Q7S87_03365 [Agitococcus sp.]|nr:hypothetical protein [Agitococcus sp.]MDO9178676.1 hypothetical protein [Agitococcus sp.]